MTLYAAIFGLGIAGGSVILLGFIFIPKVSIIYTIMITARIYSIMSECDIDSACRW